MPTFDPKKPMEIYLCDSLYNPMYMIDDYSGFSWTEKFCGIGEFQMIIPYSEPALRKYLVGRYVKHTHSNFTMMIETVDRTASEDGLIQIKITGRSIDLILENRVFLGANKTINGTTQDIARYILIGSMTPNDNVHKVMEADGLPNMSVYRTDNISDARYRYDQKTGVVYDLVKSIFGIDGYGYRLDVIPASNGSDLKYIWRILSGRDKQELFFDEDIGTLYGTETIESLKTYNKYVYLSFEDSTKIRAVGETWSKNPRFPVNGPHLQRVKFVNANDLKRDDYGSWDEFLEALEFRGLREISDSYYINTITGTSSGDYIYNSDYYLGDFVTVRDVIRDNVLKSRVEEMTWSYDGGIIKSFPSFS